MMRCLSRGTAPLRLLMLLSLTLSQSFHIPLLTQHTTRPGMIQSCTITTIKTTTPSTVHSRSTSETALTMFLPPPGGGGGGNEDDGLGKVASGILTFLGVTAFFLSPLGGLFFAFFNSLIALAFLIPVGGIAAFNIWQFTNTIAEPCPNCGVPARAVKDGSPSFCLNCGSVLQARDGKIFMANPNAMSDLTEKDNVFGWLEELGGVRRTPLEEEKKKTRERTIIDIDVEETDDS